ncbi:uncharacterized protein LOC112351495 [Selaginella moellendorffii]|uniref:uncharacterized protein LOC112351495 n=1 Tax=Selaginella moellendorffii TaxID=88036 RepID=UPI000D1C24C0|nr:uncharacterized protein LOC112351495 [Selaginella moellendorffii]|eukprot:XP_024545252.1 uncharacterized protein LOC112351495 [Selaginella moellendorffii]
MEDELSGDLLGNVLRPPSLRVSRSSRTSRSVSSPHGSPSFRRQHSLTVRTPRKDEDSSLLFRWFYWLPRYFNRRLPWVFLIALWVFLVFKVYSKDPATIENVIAEDGEELRRHVALRSRSDENSVKSGLSRLARDWIWLGYMKKNRTAPLLPGTAQVESNIIEHRRTFQYIQNSSDMNFKRFQALQSGDYFLGRVVGPYDELEQKFLGMSTEKKTPARTCSSDEGRFKEFASGKRVVVLMHELSMTGSPLAMMELASEIIGCGGKVSVVVLDRRGGLLNELVQRRIPVLADKAAKSWRAAAKADLVIAGSALCASWIGTISLQFMTRGVD